MLDEPLSKVTKIKPGTGSKKPLALQKSDVKGGLVCLNGHMTGKEVYFQKSAFIIGRGKEGVDLHLSDTEVSRKHASIRATKSGFVIKDLESSNGTFVNGELISEKELKYGDKIKLGNSEFKFIVKDVSRELPQKTWVIS